MATLTMPAAAGAASLFGADAAGGRPGPALLYDAPAHSPQLANSAPFAAPPLLVSGTDAYRSGEYLYQDYIFDDHGADTTPGAGSSLLAVNGPPLFSPFAGDMLYPSSSRFLGNAADLVELRIKPTAAAIVYRLTLNTVTAPDAAVVGIGINMHRGAGAPVQWPLGAGVSSPGLDEFITAWGTGATVTRFPSGASTPLPSDAVHMDMATRQMTIVVPRSVMDPGSSTWRYVAGTGLWDGHRWMQVGPGATAAADQPVSGNPLVAAPAVFNLAFRFNEPHGSVPGTGAGLPGYSTQPGTGSWFEDQQAKDLSQGNTGSDFADVDFAVLAAGADRNLHAPGMTQARIYASRLPIAQGVDHTGPFPEYGGSLQPYLIRLPPGYDPRRAWPLTLALHPSFGSYTLFDVFTPNWGGELGDQRRSILVANLARGINGPDPTNATYNDSAEGDMFETWADVARHFSLDPGRTTATGYSLGAYAAYAVAEESPDLFANIFSVVGTPPTNGRNDALIANLRWVPVLAWNQLDDSEVPYNGPATTQATLTQLGYRHEAWTFPAGGHLAPALRDDWKPAVPWLGAETVTRSPGRFDYGYFPSLDNASYDLVHDHAYWVSRLRLADTKDPSPMLARADVSADSLAFGQGDPTATDYTTTGSVGGATAAVQGTRWSALGRRSPRNELHLSLANIAGATVDGAGAQLTATRALRIEVRSDHAAQLRLVLAFARAADASATGPTGAAASVDRAGANLTVPGGDSVFTFSPSPTTRRACASLRRLTIHLQLARGERIAALRLTINARPIRVRPGRAVAIDLRGRPLGVYTIRIRARTTHGHTITLVRHFRTCTPARRRRR